MQLRPARPDDLPQLHAFEQGIIAAERPFDATLKPDPIHYYDLAALISDPNACVLVAEQDGRLIASGFARIRESRSFLQHPVNAYLGFMYVLPEFRGRGVNGTLVRALIEWAHERGISEVQLDVYAQNPSAIRAYEKLGFVPNLIEMRLAKKT
jgi:ribosomal protein S18 acetylase RimI-like enzyme